MYAFRTRHGPADLCFTDRFGGVSAAPYDELDLALEGGDDPGSVRHNLHRLLDDFAPGAELCDLVQVHGADVVEVDRSSPVARPRGDALATREVDVVLMVRAADCVPVLLHAGDAGDAGAVAAVHCGRPGLLAGVVGRTVERLRGWGADDVTAWVGPHVCGACYEVPADLQDEVATAVPAARATTSCGGHPRSTSGPGCGPSSRPRVSPWSTCPGAPASPQISTPIAATVPPRAGTQD